MSFKISCLLFIRDASGRLLLIKRAKKPNLGLWSPPGGKLDMELGESPVECAKREAFEETGVVHRDHQLRLFGYVSEKNYENEGHWLMFLFESLLVIEHLPESFDEGHFNFFHRSQINELPIPPSDHKLIWPYYDNRSSGFWGIKADCSSGLDLNVEVNPEL